MDRTEIVQLYVSPAKEGAVGKLEGFKRVDLKAGEQKTVAFHVYTDQLGHYVEAKDANGNFLPGHWAIEPGKYSICLTASSADNGQKGEITLKGEKYEPKLRRHYFAD